MRRALPGSEYYDGSAPPAGSAVGAPIPDYRPGAGSPGATDRWFPRSPCFARWRRSPTVSRRPRHGYAAGLSHGLPVGQR